MSRGWWSRRRVPDRERPVYVVAGFKGSGTTMMMEALEAGGMRVARAPRGHASHEYYELAPEGLHDEIWQPGEIGGVMPYTLTLSPEGFPSRHRGRVIKLVVPSIAYVHSDIPLCGLFIHRDVEHIRESLRRRFNLAYQEGQVERLLTREVNRWRSRGWPLLEVLYERVLEDPLTVMEQVRDAGFPINPLRAALVVEPARPQSGLEAVSA